MKFCLFVDVGVDFIDYWFVVLVLLMIIVLSVFDEGKGV